MVRVHRQRAVSAAPAAARHKSTAQVKKPSYRIVFEQVQEKKKKKKLATTFYGNAKAPPGHTFIPAGDPQITNRCKQLAKEDGVRVYIVSTSRHKHQANLSHQVHRIGYHFPSYIVEKACMSLGISLTKSGHIFLRRQNAAIEQARLDEEKWALTKKQKRVQGTHEESPESNISQATLDTQAREAIKDLFPKIPNKDLHEIIARAFQKGKSRVGTAPLSLPRRVQLAVVAHIRHIYTDYDKLLKTGSWLEARERVEQPCLDQLAQWRGDDEDDDPEAMEDILREVIVIPDDDEEDEHRQMDDGDDLFADREDSVEIISSHALADDMQMQPVDYRTRSQNDNLLRSHSTKPNHGNPIQYIGPEDRPYILFEDNQYDQNKWDRIELVHRQRAWGDALDRRRKNPDMLYTTDSRPVPNNDQMSSRDVMLQEKYEPHGRRLERLPQQIPSMTKVKHGLLGENSSTRGLPSQGVAVPAAQRLDFDRGPNLGETILPAQVPVFSRQPNHVAKRPRELMEPLDNKKGNVRLVQYHANHEDRSNHMDLGSSPIFVKSRKVPPDVHDVSHRQTPIQVLSPQQHERILPSIEATPQRLQTTRSINNGHAYEMEPTRTQVYPGASVVKQRHPEHHIIDSGSDRDAYYLLERPTFEGSAAPLRDKKYILDRSSGQILPEQYQGSNLTRQRSPRPRILNLENERDFHVTKRPRIDSLAPVYRTKPYEISEQNKTPRAFLVPIEQSSPRPGIRQQPTENLFTERTGLNTKGEHAMPAHPTDTRMVSVGRPLIGSYIDPDYRSIQRPSIVDRDHIWSEKSKQFDALRPFTSSDVPPQTYTMSHNVPHDSDSLFPVSGIHYTPVSPLYGASDPYFSSRRNELVPLPVEKEVLGSRNLIARNGGSGSDSAQVMTRSRFEGLTIDPKGRGRHNMGDREGVDYDQQRNYSTLQEKRIPNHAYTKSHQIIPLSKVENNMQPVLDETFRPSAVQQQTGPHRYPLRSRGMQEPITLNGSSRHTQMNGFPTIQHTQSQLMPSYETDRRPRFLEPQDQQEQIVQERGHEDEDRKPRWLAPSRYENANTQPLYRRQPHEVIVLD